MKPASELKTISENWFRDGVFRTMERHAENGLSGCSICLYRVPADEIDPLILNLQSAGYKVVDNRKNAILEVSWMDGMR